MDAQHSSPRDVGSKLATLLQDLHPSLVTTTEAQQIVEAFLLHPTKQNHAQLQSVLDRLPSIEKALDTETIRSILEGWQLLMQQEGLQTLEELFVRLQKHKADYQAFIEKMVDLMTTQDDEVGENKVNDTFTQI